MASKIIAFRGDKDALIKHVRRVTRKRKPNLSAWVAEAVAEKIGRETAK